MTRSGTRCSNGHGREERIRRDEQELRLLVDSVPQLIGTVNPDGTMLHMNRAALTMSAFRSRTA